MRENLHTALKAGPRSFLKSCSVAHEAKNVKLPGYKNTQIFRIVLLIEQAYYRLRPAELLTLAFSNLNEDKKI